MIIQRERYLEEIRAVTGKQIIKVLTGMRRVGKSTLLQQIQGALIASGVAVDQIISVNFELMEYEPINEYHELDRYIRERMVNTERYYVFLDEIQEVSGFEKVVNSLNAEGNAELFITGSNSRLLSGELATYLTGRYYAIEILPLSFLEILSLDPKDEREQALLRYLRTGGLPGILHFEIEAIRRNYLLDMYQSILLKDIIGRYHIRNVDLLQRFMRFIMHNIGQTFSAGTITKYLKSEGRRFSKETIYQYIDAAKQAYLIHGVPRYDIKGKELLKTNEKYFINDLGLRSLFFDNEQDISQVLENLVYLHLRGKGYEIYIGKYQEKEVDFITVKANEKQYIQVAYLLAEPATIEREFSVLEQIDDNYPKLVLSLDRVNRSRNGIIHRNLINFLLE